MGVNSMPTYKEKNIPVQDHDVNLKISGESAAKVGPELVEHLKEFSGSSQKSLDD